MPENEIKFVVRNYEEHERSLTPLGWHDIEQGYLNPNNRIRLISYPDHDDFEYFFTYKQRLPNGHNLELGEFPLGVDVGIEAWQCTQERLRKRRVSIVHDKLKWDIDFYRWKAPYFVLAEVEMPASMQHPTSILPHIEKDIVYEVPRDDGRFTARLLADEDHVRKLARELHLIA